MLCFIETLRSIFPNPDYAVLGILASIACFYYHRQSQNMKMIYLKAIEDKSSRSNEAKEKRTRQELMAYFLFFVACMLFVMAFAAHTDVRDIFGKRKPKVGKVEEVPNSDNGFVNDSLPIISIPRVCVPTMIHEGQNYSLIAGSFDDPEEAMKKKSQLETFRIRDIEYFPKECDSIYGVYGKYLLFVGRKFNSLSSAENKEIYYEERFARKSYPLNLKIVKFENKPFSYTYNGRLD